ncbi:hypothetical protein PSTG_19745, partial [Puccinia striiformis f. sp. tritici PST-78]
TTSNSISDHPDTNPNDDLLTFETHATNGPSACSASEPAPNIDPLSPYTDHQSDNRPHHVSFDPKARIIPTQMRGTRPMKRITLGVRGVIPDRDRSDSVPENRFTTEQVN